MNDKGQTDRLYKLQDYISDGGTCFCYLGPISQTLIEGMGQTIQDWIRKESNNFTLALKVFSIFVEQAQNIEKYSLTIMPDASFREKTLTEGIITLGKKNKKYFIEFGNFINISEEINLKERLDEIKKMNKKSIIQSYKAQMMKSIDLESQSVGAGFFEIARNASEPLEYDIKPIDKQFSFFSLKVSV